MPFLDPSENKQKNQRANSFSFPIHGGPLSSARPFPVQAFTGKQNPCLLGRPLTQQQKNEKLQQKKLKSSEN
jgi:hypothetical protein